MGDVPGRHPRPSGHDRGAGGRGGQGRGAPVLRRHPPRGAAGHPGHRQAPPTRWHQHLPPGRGEDRRALGAVGSANPDAAARRHPGPGRARGPDGLVSLPGDAAACSRWRVGRFPVLVVSLSAEHGRPQGRGPWSIQVQPRRDETGDPILTIRAAAHL